MINRDFFRKKWAQIQWRRRKFGQIRKSLCSLAFGKERENVVKHGLAFITGFPKIIVPGRKRKRFSISILPSAVESRIAVVLCVEHLGRNRLQKHTVTPWYPNESDPGIRIADAPVKFSDGSVDIETFNGSPGARPFHTHFDSVTGKR